MVRVHKFLNVLNMARVFCTNYAQECDFDLKSGGTNSGGRTLWCSWKPRRDVSSPGEVLGSSPVSIQTQSLALRALHKRKP